MGSTNLETKHTKILPVVSVRVMTYNHGPYIEDCLVGINNQRTSFNFEVVIGDDFSQDDTLDKIENFNFSNPHLVPRVLHRRKGDAYDLNRQAKGRLYNFYDIVNRCKGKYVAFLDGDDYWTDPLKLQKQFDFLEANQDFGICYHHTSVLHHESQIISRDTITREVPEVASIEELSIGNFMHTPTVMLRNDFNLPNWFFDVFTGDWACYMFAINDRKIKRLDQDMSVYRQHEGGIWSGKKRIQRMRMTVNTFILVRKNVEMGETAAAHLDSRIEEIRGAIRQEKLNNLPLRKLVKQKIKGLKRRFKKLL